MSNIRPEENCIKTLDEKLEMDQLLKLFTIFPTEEDLLYEALEEHQKIFEGLRYRAIISDEQYESLLPYSRLTDFSQFDYHVLHLLIYKFTDLKKPETGWESEPLDEDQSESACYVRVYLARKAISLIKPPVSYAVYHGIFNYARQPLLDLGNEKRSLTCLSVPKKFGATQPHQHYVGRKDEIAEIDDYLHKPVTPDAPRKAVIVHGPNGIGKRELVRMYIRLKGYRYGDNIIWLDSSTNHNLQKSIRTLCQTLSLSIADAHGDVMDSVALMESVHEYFLNSTVLFIFENVQSMKQIASLISSNELSYTIITTTKIFCARRFNHTSVSKLPLTTAEDYLKRALPIGDPFQTVSLRKHLAKSLRFNPLALSLATAFITHSQTSTWDYIYAVKTVVKEHMPRRVVNKKDRILTSNYTAFYLTCNALAEKSLSVFILKILSYLNNSSIDATLVEEILKHCEMHANMSNFNQALDFLVKLSLIQITEGSGKDETKQILIHSSIQEVNRIYQMEYSTNKLRPFHCILDYIFKFSGFHQQRHLDCGQTWLDHLMYIFEAKSVHSHFLLKCKQNQDFLLDVFSSKGLCHDLLPIYKKLENICEKRSKDRFNIKIMIAKCFQNLGQLGLALSEFEDIEYRLIKNFGEDDPLSIETRFLKTSLIYKQQRYTTALELCNGILTQMTKLKMDNPELRLQIQYLVLKCKNKSGEKTTELSELESIEKEKSNVFQENHPCVFRIQYDIGKHLLKAGYVPKAIAKFRTLESVQLKILGEKHKSVLKTKTKLSECFNRLHDYEQSLPYLDYIRNSHKQLYGPEHIIALHSERAYVECLQNTCRHDEAYDVLSRIETVQQNHHGSYKIDDIISTKQNVANTLQVMGYYPEALDKYQDMLQMQRAYYEDDTHPEILKTKHSFANCIHELGYLEEATKLFKEIELEQIKKLGENHQDVLRTQNNLSVCLIDSCQEKKAFKELKEVEEKQKSTLTTHHPELLVTQTNMAVCLHKRQYFDRAYKKYQDVLHYQKQHFGERSLVVLTLKHQIAICVHDQGNSMEALQKYDEVYNAVSAYFGADHPETLRIRYNRAICYYDCKKYKRAFHELELVEDLQMDVLGENHPDTLRTQTSLNICGRDVNNVLLGGPGNMCTIV
eukprot:TCONS_00070081-protein